MDLTLESILNKYQITDLSKLPPDMVGPVLMKDDFSYVIVEAIALDNPKTFMGVVDRGSYLRVLGERELVLRKSRLEELDGREVRFPGEVEIRMSSFAGKIQVSGEQIRWYLEV
ncbi:hypothetical protein L3N51_01489 [Metallosphaera sp. J1]|nr:hypothetical protein [Metallosphaera javensis (ex Hofmann et al. 2022)]